MTQFGYGFITFFEKNRKHRVVVDGKQLSLIHVVSGVPQGTVLGPLLFLLHINDLLSVVSSNVRHFVDDCLIYRNIKNKEDQITLQKDLNLIENWGNTWGMRFNAAKCNILSYHIIYMLMTHNCISRLSVKILWHHCLN